MENGTLLIEHPLTNTASGKFPAKPKRVIVNDEQARLRARIGVDLGGTKIECVVLRPDGSEWWRKRIPSPRGNYRSTIQAVTNLVREAGHATDSECSIGIGTPGALSAASGLMKNCNSVWLNAMPLKADLETAIGR